jgi:hypothetical protein
MRTVSRWRRSADSRRPPADRMGSHRRPRVWSASVVLRLRSCRRISPSTMHRRERARGPATFTLRSLSLRPSNSVIAPSNPLADRPRVRRLRPGSCVLPSVRLSVCHDRVIVYLHRCWSPRRMPRPQDVQLIGSSTFVTGCDKSSTAAWAGFSGCALSSSFVFLRRSSCGARRLSPKRIPPRAAAQPLKPRPPRCRELRYCADRGVYELQAPPPPPFDDERRQAAVTYSNACCTEFGAVTELSRSTAKST